MKASLFTVPIVIAAFLVVAVWSLGMLAVKASAVSTQTSLEMLRLHLRVARLHDELQARSRESLAADGLMAYPGAAPSPGVSTPGYRTSPSRRALESPPAGGAR